MVSNILTNAQINVLCLKYGFTFRVIKSILSVETGMHGFSDKTGRILIQFEPSWFKRYDTDWRKETKHVLWQSNTVGDQTAEWKAFNDAYAQDPDAAMKSTSIGIGQIMGFHFAELGFKTVGAMWDFAKISESNQLELILKWIKSVPALARAVEHADFKQIAYYYNGEGYEKFRYDTRLEAAYRLQMPYVQSAA